MLNLVIHNISTICKRVNVWLRRIASSSLLWPTRSGGCTWGCLIWVLAAQSQPSSACLPAWRVHGSVATCWSQGTQSNHRTALTSFWLAWDLFQNIWHLTVTCPVPPLMDFSGVGGHNYRVMWLMHKLCRWWSCLWFVFDMIWWLKKVTVGVDHQHLGQ